MYLRLYFSLVLFCLLSATVHSQEPCKESFDSLRCFYRIECEDYFVLRDSSYYRHQYHNGEQWLDQDRCVNDIQYNGDNYDPFYLIYKDNRPDVSEAIPRFRYGHSELVATIVFLNLSINEYGFTPQLKQMQNLAALDISKNYLTTAQLYNIYELPLLTEIDLSHNTISDIEVLPDQHAYRKLKVINLSHNYLVNVPETIFDSFEELETLDLSHNFIDTLSPLTFEGIKHLLHLNISNNRLSDINSALLRFHELKVLQLGHNKLQFLRTRDFEKLNKLENLDLSSNSIAALDKNVFQNMPLLYDLDLSNNLLEMVDKETFLNVTNLRLINLSVNNFKALPEGLFKGKTISSFLIQGNSMEGALKRGSFEGLKFISELDLSKQQLTAIDDYAFLGVERLQILLLNNNNIQSLSKKCFKSLQNLSHLDLSYNRITNIEFEKDDLYSLRLLSLRNNYLTQVKYEHFRGFNSLEYLGLTNNNISHLQPNSFKSLKELVNFDISNNPLNAILEKNTFDGLNSLPSLDISRTLLTTIQNSSFSDMIHLRNLNISRSKVQELQYNIFCRTGSIETIDLSYNQLEEFNVNTTELAHLGTIFLNNNLIKAISSRSLLGLSRLGAIHLANNDIKTIHDDAFRDQNDLQNLDLSYNSNLKFNVSLVKSSKNLNSLCLSGINTPVSFTKIGDESLLSTVEISHAGITDIKPLELIKLKHLEHLVLSYNDIAKLEATAFSNITNLKNLDLSFNNITFIQPGVFKDNALLHTLNISHNSLTALSYGIFRGLIYLNTLDMSYNYISDLQSERFYEVISLTVLIADHNRINSLNAEEFIGTSLKKLSIGENPLPCDILVNLKKSSVSFEVTSIRLDETSDIENIDGVTCNTNKHLTRAKSISEKPGENYQVLTEIRDILFNHSNVLNNHAKEHSSVLVSNNDSKNLENVTSRIEKSILDSNNKLSSNFINVTKKMINVNDNTNTLLERILNVLTLNSVRRTTYIPIAKENTTNGNILSLINKIKTDLEDNVAAKQIELDMKISEINSRIDGLLTTDAPKHDKYLSSDAPLDTKSKSLFTETCVALILLILVCFVLFKFYKSRMFIRNRFSISTRELPSAMDNSTL